MVTLKQLREAYRLGYERHVASYQSIAVAARGLIGTPEDSELNGEIQQADSKHSRLSRLERVAYQLGSLMASKNMSEGREYHPIIGLLKKE